MSYGHFSDDCSEYIITNPATPRPWHNYLYNEVYQANVTQLGTGASFYQPLGEGLRANLTEDKDGTGGPRFVYLRDAETGEYWSLTGAPDNHPLEAWRCRVGLGYQINESANRGIRASWRAFVPQTRDTVELWSITVENMGEVARNISVFPYVEMHLTGGSTLMDFISVLGGHYDAGSNAVFGINSCVKFPDYFKAFLASDVAAAASTVSRDEFLGAYRGYANPLAVETGAVDNPEAGTEWLGASLRHDLVVAPGASVTINCAVGICASVEEGREFIGRYLAEGEPARLFEALAAEKRALCEGVVVSTPDAQFDHWMNVWLKHQLTFVARWGRVIGRGYRDVLQDCFAHRITEPARARACIKEVFSKQYPSGRCIRAWRLPHAILDLQHYADSPSWMIMALAYYLKETADFALLNEQVPYLNADDPYAASTQSGTVWEHVVLAQRHLLEHRGQHGLSKIYYGDWCDTMNGVGARGEGESVMLAMQVKWGCDLLAELASRLAETAVAGEMKSASAELDAAIEEHAWDGAWYRRAFDDDGIPVGSANPPPEDNGEGLIFLNPQAWALISGIGEGERQQSAVKEAHERLDTGYGVTLNAPPFTGLKPRIGQMTAMSPGFYENGSVYVHGNCFWIYGLGVAGFADESFEAFRAVLPDTDNKPNTDTEPFVIPNYYIGPNVTRRKQRNLYLSGWRTGSAAWLFMTGLECCLGVAADYDGLRIAPQLPRGWSDASVRRPFRGDVYEVAIRREGTGNAIKRITVDGVSVPGTLVPPVGDGCIHTVDVIIG